MYYFKVINDLFYLKIYVHLPINNAENNNLQISIPYLPMLANYLLNSDVVSFTYEEVIGPALRSYVFI